MSYATDRAAAVVRGVQAHSTITATDPEGPPTALADTCVRVNLQNADANNAVKITLDGSAPTGVNGWNLAAGESTGWIPIAGGTEVRALALIGVPTQINVWQVLDAEPA